MSNIILKPKSMRQWLDWTERLDDAGCQWWARPSEVKNPKTEQEALSSLICDEIDAKNILGITVLGERKN